MDGVPSDIIIRAIKKKKKALEDLRAWFEGEEE